MMKALLMAGALALMPASAFAQSAAPGTIATATRLIDVLKVQGPLDKLFDGLMPMLSANVISTLEKTPGAPAEFKAMLADPTLRLRAQTIVSEEVLKSVRARYPDVMAASAREYAAAFTEADLQTMLAFYQSPTGQRLLAAQAGLQNAMTAQGQTIGMSAAQESLPVALKRIAQLPPPPAK